MKTLILAVVAFATITSASAQEKFTLRGVVRDTALYGQTVVLTDNDARQTLGSTTIAPDGTYRFSCNVTAPRVLYIRIPTLDMIGFVAHAGTITIVTDTLSHVSGTPANVGYQQLYEQVTKPLNDFYKHANSLNDEQYKAASEQFFAKYDAAMPRVLQDLVECHRDDFSGGEILYEWARRNSLNLSNERLDSLAGLLGAAARSNPHLQNELGRRVAAKRTEIGQQLVEIEGVDTLGDKIRLSDFTGRGQWVVVDFWSSWCGGCSHSTRNLIAMQQELRDHNCIIVGVNVWENSDSDAVKSMVKKSVTWPNIIVRGNYMTNSATLNYGVLAIPTMLLIDPSGKIVVRTNFLNLDEVKQLVTKTN